MDSISTKSIQLPVSVTIDGIDELYTQLKQLESPGNESISLDASQVNSITTPGVQLILSLERSLNEHNLKLSLVNPTENFKETFSILGLGTKLGSWGDSHEA